ncbi:MAG: translocation/assembly module TamB domain-containing protein [Planctomycetales bacterium]|nr:MAG: translocation/assembly module TamB domain-containing protein [Planctomycetales bacterium]
MDNSRQQIRGSKVTRHPRFRRVLRGCIWTLVAAFVLMAAGSLILSRNADRLLKDRIIRMADESLNGELVFSNIKVDLFGRAVFKDITLTLNGESDPVITARSAVVSLDLLNLIGPNRGQVAIVAELVEPHVKLIRLRDGTTNLEKLIKEPPQEKKQENFGLSLRISNGTLDFEDRCLLSSDYPRIEATEGPLADLLKELNYDILAPAETRPHKEEIKLHGSVNVNSGRGELSFAINAVRPDDGGRLTVSGDAGTESGRLDMRIQGRDISASSLQEYGNAIFPALTILPEWEEQPGIAKPTVAAVVRTVDFRLQRKDLESPFSQVVSADIEDTSFNSDTFPFLALENAEIRYDQAKDELELNKLSLSGAGTEITGSAQFGPDSGELGGRVTIKATDIAQLLAQLPYEGPEVSGSIELDLRPGGTLDDPQVAAGFTGGKLSYDGHLLGRPGGRIELNGNMLQLDSLRFSGGELPVSASGSLDIEKLTGELSYEVTKADIATLLGMAKEQMPEDARKLSAAGKLSAKGSLSLKDKQLTALDAQLNASGVEFEGVRLGNIRGGASMKGERIAFNELQLSGGQVPLTLNGSLDPEKGDAELRFKLGRTGLAELLALADEQLPADVKDLKPSGTVSADGSLNMQARKLSSASGTLNGNTLVVAGVKLGTVAAKVSTADGKLKVENASFSGGEVPLKLSGSSDLAFQNGSFSIEAGPLGVDKAATLAGRFSDKPLDTMGLTGNLKASGKLGFEKGKPSSTLSLTSDLLEKDGNRLEKLSVKGSLKGSSFELDAATATFVTAEALDLGGFSSPAPLRVPLRVGGSVSSTGKDSAVSLVGSASTENLQPSQAELSFKLVGPADSPQLRAQLKTNHDSEPLVVNVEAYVSGGMKPATAKLTWYDSQLFYDGKADLAKQAFDGHLTASQISLDKFIDDEHISGEFSLDGQLSGTATQPTLTGRMASPRISYVNGKSRHDITDLAIGFKLKDGNAVSVSNGKFLLDRQPFSVDGVLGTGGADLTIECRDFNLLSALALVPTTADSGPNRTASQVMKVDSHGPLTVKLSGTVEKPNAAVSYSSGAGQVNGTRFDSAKLKATVTKDQAVLDSFEIISASGSASAQGGATFDPVRFNADVDIRSFDVQILTALAGGTALGELRGQLNGSIRASGGTESYSADGDITLNKGRFGDVDISELKASLRTHPDGIEITGARLTASGTTLTASGIIASDLNHSRVSAKAEQIDLSLFNPLMPKGGAQLDGIVSLDAKLSPSKGNYPDVDVTIADKGSGITVDGSRIDKLTAKLTLRGDQATLNPLRIEKGGSSLNVGGKLDLSQLKPGSRRIPLDLSVTADSFQLDDIAGFLPDEAASQMPGGNITCNMSVKGNSLSPVMNGELALNILRMPPALPLDLAELRAQFSMKNNEFSIRSMDLVPNDSSYYATRVTGSARLAFNPPRVADGSVSIVFSEGGNHSRISLRTPNARGDQVKAFEGTLGGTIQLRTSQDLVHPDDAGTQIWVISGNPVINGGSGESNFRYAPGPKREPSSAKVPLRFDNLTVMVMPGSKFTTGDGLLEMDSAIHTEPPGLVINGIPNALLASDQLSIRGNVILDRGTLRAFTNTMRLDESRQNRLHFTGMTTNTGLFPYLTARASTTLKGALRNEQQNALGPTNNDLKVNFDFDNVQLDPESDIMSKVRLTSEPPRSPNQIKVYLLGGVGTLLSGEGELSDVAREELLGLGGNFLSGQLEKGLGLDSVTIAGSGDINNPFHVGAEKDVNDRLRVGYFRDFYDSLGTSEEISFKYKLFEEQLGSRYKGVNLQFNVKDDALQGSGSEIMLQYTFSF